MRWVPVILAAVALVNASTPSGKVLPGDESARAQHILSSLKEGPSLPLGSESLQQSFTSITTTNSGDVVYEQYTHPAFSKYSLRLARPRLCDPSVKQYSGYLDISDTRHLFFCSTTGLLFENGPCTIVDNTTTTPNPYSWNIVTNMLFLDQPFGTGYSYASDQSKVDTLADLAVDVFAFLQLFMTRFPEYAEKPFHLAAESWGGHYGPNIASYVHKMNKQRIYAPFPGQRHINFASIILANGLAEPATQFASVPEYLCGAAPYPPFEHDSAECRAMRVETPVCKRMIEACYRFPSTTTCDPETVFCWLRVFGPISRTGLNPYDLRVPCEDPSGLCYKEMQWVQNWMNTPAVKRELGVDNSPVEFVHCNRTVNTAFYLQGQAMRNSAALLPPLVNDGMRLLVFAGDTDGLCNHIGIHRWMMKLEHNLHEELLNAPFLPFISRYTGGIGGKVQSAGDWGAGNVTFVQIFDGGHMAPHDQPEATLDMITRWVKNIPFDVVG